MDGPNLQDEPYIDEHELNHSEVSDEIEDSLREGTEGWYPEDANDDDTIWRYMDLGKFISLIQTRQLWLSHRTTFDDPYEGRYSKSVAEDIQRETWGVDEPSDEDTEFFVDDDSEDYVSCWNLKNTQSAALWEMYVDGDNGIAIKSTVGKLKRSIDWSPTEGIERLIEIGKVKYHITGEEPIGYYAPIFTKRSIFDFEQEYRVVLTTAESLESVEGEDIKIRPNIGIGVKVDLDTLIEEVYISPSASGYLQDVVEDIRDDYGGDYPIENSSVFDHPLV